MDKIKVLLLVVVSFFFSFYPRAQELYVGANYHPHDDKDPVKIKKDIQMMKDAGFKAVRLGHLAWDSYEPSEGKFDFKWFDKVMDMMHEAGIKVILDLAIRPAPIWLHHKYPSIDIVDANGNVLYPNHRYMEDVGDPMYVKYAVRYADSLTRHYGKHPALLAFGIDNESGDGRFSYSETARKRFITWLQKKYGTLDNLNRAWATQRWSRRINKFEEIGFPVASHKTDVPEKMLDLRRFVSDEINQILFKVIDKVNTNAPNALTNTNAWYYSSLKYFDYSQIAYSGKMTREGCGFYPGNSLTTNWGVMNALFGISRIQFESTNPFWCSEFTTMTAVPNSIRKSAYATLMYGNQMVCGWTWQSMHSGEEQYLEGMLDWDGLPNRKYYEYKKIATEFKKIEKFFPYIPQAEVGLAFSFPSQIASNSFPEQHDDQLQACFNLFYWRNMDARVVEIGKSSLKYKLLFVPGVAVMDEATADKVRDFVKNGGTVVMTANSAIVDETGKVFAATHPGRLSDVFGIRVGSYEETESLNEISRRSYKGKKIALTYKGKEIQCESDRFDVIEPKGAEVLGSITSLDKDYPVITSNQFGMGRAIYVGLPAKGEVLDPIVDELIKELSLKRGPEVPAGVMARQVDKDHILYLNVSGEPKEIQMNGNARSILFDKEYKGSFIIPPYEPDFIEVRSAMARENYQSPVRPGNEPVAAGRFEPTWQSLQQYKTPEWFRNAKFGIWAHWGPQCQPEQGDWYARYMYNEGSDQYKWQVAHYGHPSKAGFKEVINDWKAQNWDPEKLVALYKRAGAQYFFAMANHHDNLDLWNSKYQEWNSVRVGPKQDIVAGWAKAAKKYGLPFGLSVHASRTWTWMETSQRSDKKGPFEGIPYDGKLTKADGKGTWWDGLDPQQLYAQGHPLSVNSWDINGIFPQWNWTNGASIPSQDYCDKFYNRTIDLINRFNPDLLYFDDTGLPLYPISDAGLKIAAHYYNHNMATHDGRLDAVLFGKVLTDEQKKCMVWDVERGAPENIEPNAWQTCTCIGDWHYKRSIYEKNEYKSATTVIHMLIDIVSKNGNLLLNIPVRGDGTIDEKEIRILEEIAAWMDINKESIFDTRPWIIYGEGPTTEVSNSETAPGFNEGKKKFSSKDIRYNQKGNILYATVMGVPTSDITMKAPGKNKLGKSILNVEIVGSKEKLSWKQYSDSLVIGKPKTIPDKIAVVFKITY